jgi:hypothetical protein
VEARDRELLLGFLEQARVDLLFVFDAAQPFLHPSVAERLWPAWEALEARNEFGALRDAIESRDYDRQLDRAGLSGPELDFKLAGVDAASSAARERRSPRLLRRLLNWLELILDSLLSATGIGEGIKELKEGVKSDLEPEPEG